LRRRAEDELVQRAVIGSLGRIESEESVKILLTILRTTMSALIQRKTVDTLGMMNPEVEAQAVQKAFKAILSSPSFSEDPLKTETYIAISRRGEFHLLPPSLIMSGIYDSDLWDLVAEQSGLRSSEDLLDLQRNATSSPDCPLIRNIAMDLELALYELEIQHAEIGQPHEVFREILQRRLSLSPEDLDLILSKTLKAQFLLSGLVSNSLLERPVYLKRAPLLLIASKLLR